jgi:hypothetical protein
MRQHEIKMGWVYVIRDRGKLVEVRVDKIQATIILGSKASPRARYTGTVLRHYTISPRAQMGSSVGKVVQFSAQRVQREVGPDTPESVR